MSLNTDEKKNSASREDQVLLENPSAINKESNILNLAEEKAEEKKDLNTTENEEDVFSMREYKKNYAVSGDPDTKIQFSFKFKLAEDLNLFLGYTQVLFWELEKVSKPFSDVNYNPDLFYNINLGKSYFGKLKLGYEHNSNGKASLESRSYDSAFVTLIGESSLRPGVPKLYIKLRTLHRIDETNEDIEEYYGNFNLKISFMNLGKRLFRSEEFYLEYYTSNKFDQIVDRSSVRLSLRFKIFKTKTAPKIFLQYFNGFGENLANYDQKTETFRLGFSIGGQ